MAITRTAKGTASAKTGTTLTIGSVQIDAGAFLVVGIAYEGANPTSVTYGAKDMTIVSTTTFTRGDSTVRLYRFKVKTARTKDIVATWAVAPTAQAMFATEIKEASVLDQSGGQGLASGTALDTTSVGTTTVADTIAIAAFCALGPSGDAQGTAGSGHTLGQRVGTAGGGAASNVTIQETYEILSATGATQATLTLVTARASAQCIAAFRSRDTWTLDTIDQPGYRAGALGNAAVFRWSNVAGDDHDVLVPADLFESSTDQELLDFCVQALELKSEVDDNEDPAVDTLDGTRVTALEGSSVVL